jgi:cell division protein FtsQ
MRTATCRSFFSFLGGEKMDNGNNKVSSIEDRIPRLKELRKQKANKRLIFYISLFFLLIAFIVYSQSPLSNLQNVSITGNTYLSDEIIHKQIELNKQMNFWEIETDVVKEKLLVFEQIENVEVDKSWYNTITITIEEHRHIAYLQIDGQYFPIIENGNVLEALEENEWPVDAPILVNWQKGEKLHALASQLIKMEQQISSRISEIHYNPSDIDPWRILLFMNDGYEVTATVSNLADNIAVYPSILKELKMEGYPEGIIHLEVGSYFEYANEN